MNSAVVFHLYSTFVMRLSERSLSEKSTVNSMPFTWGFFRQEKEKNTEIINKKTAMFRFFIFKTS